ncbi:MAG: right-handed parallel beta-helix repeat-containing protein [Candidatus Hydrogenedentes bacterium]|nr:right-handed parallel beta-helix repeat-containing protein [Candidatus Hydrogenedentota bacterium]
MFGTVYARLGLFIVAMLAGHLISAQETLPAHIGDPAAIAEVEAGTRAVANAAWWGFNAEDSTDALQAAINSKAKTVVVPYMGAPWIVRPITLRSNLELIFEPGVLILAKKGEFKGGGDSLFRAVEMTDITIRGYGATLRMRKKDYQSADYQRAEWRMGISFSGCKRVLVEGVRVESTGGDGFYVGSGGATRWCEDVTIRNCVSHDNHRQGLSVISAVNLLVENCVFSGTSGTPPEAGIDLECDSADERFVNCVIRNCVFENNSGHAMLVYLKPMTSESEPVSIRFENCHARMGSPGMTLDDFTDMGQKGWAGMSIGAIGDNGPKGTIEFINCTTENTGKEGAKIYDKSAKSAVVRFVNCSWKQPWVSSFREYGGLRVPVYVHLRRPSITQDMGGIEFVDCHVYDTAPRPAIAFYDDQTDTSVRDISGSITVHGPEGNGMKLGPGASNITLQVKTIPAQAPAASPE